MELAVFATLPCDALGEKGCVRLYTRASGRAEFSVQGEQLHYAGVFPPFRRSRVYNMLAN